MKERTKKLIDSLVHSCGLGIAAWEAYIAIHYLYPGYYEDDDAV